MAVPCNPLKAKVASTSIARTVTSRSSSNANAADVMDARHRGPFSDVPWTPPPSAERLSRPRFARRDPYTQPVNSVCSSSNPRAGTFRQFCHPPSARSPAQPDSDRPPLTRPGAPRSPSRSTISLSHSHQ